MATKVIRPLIVAHSDYQGGAARAAWRLHKALCAGAIESEMLVGTKGSGDWRVRGPSGKLEEGFARVRPTLDGILGLLQRSANSGLHSPAWLSGVSAAALNRSTHTVTNLHWTCGGYLSVELIGALKKPVVWTMHDMWPFCGAEHYAEDGSGARWRVGYSRLNRPVNNGGVDVDRWVWRRKERSWRTPINVVCPSRWLANCVRSSALMSRWPVRVIPNALDVSVYKPLDRSFARQVLNLPLDREIVLFGALGGGADPRKGWDLLQGALRRLAPARPEMIGVIFGQREPRAVPNLGLPLVWMGHIADDYTLALLYSAADVMVVPSRQENLPQSATEAQACGCPVVAFDVTGLPDAVVHSETGYLAPDLTDEALEHGLEWVLSDPSRRALLSDRARRRAVDLWSEHVVCKQYTDAFAAAIDDAQ